MLGVILHPFRQKGGREIEVLWYTYECRDQCPFSSPDRVVEKEQKPLYYTVFFFCVCVCIARLTVWVVVRWGFPTLMSRHCFCVRGLLRICCYIGYQDLALGVEYWCYYRFMKRAMKLQLKESSLYALHTFLHTIAFFFPLCCVVFLVLSQLYYA